MLKEEKLLIEKLTLIIGGFYQQTEKERTERKVSCLIKYLKQSWRNPATFKCNENTAGIAGLFVYVHVIACGFRRAREFFPDPQDSL